MKRIYLDYAATTPVHPAVLAAMQDYFVNKFGNASSLHTTGIEARSAVEGFYSVERMAGDYVDLAKKIGSRR